MTELDEREAFLRAIFDSPEDDTPRLVYADWLEEHGEEIAAKAIRLSIECCRASDGAVKTEFLDEYQRLKWHYSERLLPHVGLLRNVLQSGGEERRVSALLTTGELSDLERFRALAVGRPWLFAVSHLTLRSDTGRINDAGPFETIYRSVALRNVNALDLAGEEDPIVESTVTDDGGGLIGYPTYDTRLVPTISLAGVEALAGNRLCKRLINIDLTNNNLGNDALRALARSPYLENLRQLTIAEGNNFRGRVWQQLLERFGEEVVS
jgi:uncharacterized protein (TIGR02996 family)